MSAFLTSEFWFAVVGFRLLRGCTFAQDRVRSFRITAFAGRSEACMEGEEETSLSTPSASPMAWFPQNYAAFAISVLKENTAGPFGGDGCTICGRCKACRDAFVGRNTI
eukprot:GGOE01031038.1.p1 GENE.GGOE01031038.1~~GGOE01031038.1.p1  ORF type:complete len:109 (+),score=2.49 GGOE01031038.1:61-387(+)